MIFEKFFQFVTATCSLGHRLITPDQEWRRAESICLSPCRGHCSVVLLCPQHSIPFRAVLSVLCNQLIWENVGSVHMAPWKQPFYLDFFCHSAAKSSTCPLSEKSFIVSKYSLEILIEPLSMNCRDAAGFAFWWWWGSSLDGTQTPLENVTLKKKSKLKTKWKTNKKHPKIKILKDFTLKKSLWFSKKRGTFPVISERRINLYTEKSIWDLGGFEIIENSQRRGPLITNAGTSFTFFPVMGEVSAPLSSVFMLLVLQEKVRIQQDQSRCPLYTFNASILFDY